MEKKLKDAIRDNRVMLLDINYEEIRDYLIQYRVVTSDTDEWIRSGLTLKDKIRNFLDRLAMAGPTAYKGFCRSLDECEADYSYILEKIGYSSSSNRSECTIQSSELSQPSDCTSTSSPDEATNAQFPVSGIQVPADNNQGMPHSCQSEQNFASSAGMQSTTSGTHVQEGSVQRIPNSQNNELFGTQFVRQYTPGTHVDGGFVQIIPGSQHPSFQSDGHKGTSIVIPITHVPQGYSQRMPVPQIPSFQSDRSTVLVNQFQQQSLGGQTYLPPSLQNQNITQPSRSNSHSMQYQSVGGEIQLQGCFNNQTSTQALDTPDTYPSNMQHSQSFSTPRDSTGGVNETGNVLSSVDISHAESDSRLSQASFGTDLSNKMEDLSITTTCETTTTRTTSESRYRPCTFHKELSDEDRNRNPTEMLFGELANYIINIDHMGVALNIPIEKVQHIKIENAHSVVNQVVHLLCHWKRSCRKPTLEKLIKALHKVKMSEEIYETIINEYLEEIKTNKSSDIDSDS